MPYVTNFERSGMRKAVEVMLRTKFGELANELMDAILELNDAEKYLALIRTIVKATTLDKVRRAVAKASAPTAQRMESGQRKRGPSLPPQVQLRYEQEPSEHEKGRHERNGMLIMIVDILQFKFGDEALELREAIRELDNAEKYLALNRVIVFATALDEVRRAIAKASATTPLRKKSAPRKRSPSHW
jgi:hypothetical protein